MLTNLYLTTYRRYRQRHQHAATVWIPRGSLSRGVQQDLHASSGCFSKHHLGFDPTGREPPPMKVTSITHSPDLFTCRKSSSLFWRILEPQPLTSDRETTLGGPSATLSTRRRHRNGAFSLQPKDPSDTKIWSVARLYRIRYSLQGDQQA
jgi:hypothetical protein